MSITLNDILITVRQFMVNEYDGFKISLSEINAPADKILFIEKCKYLIKNGWDNNFEHDLDPHSDKDAYFYELKSILYKPAQGAFRNRTDLSAQSEIIINYFTRLCLLRLVFEARRDNQELYENIVNRQWLEEARASLNANFQSLIQGAKINYNGKEITDITQLQEALKTAQHVEQQHRTYVKPMLYGVVLFSLLGTLLLKDAPEEALLAKSYLSIILMLVIIGYQFKRCFALQYANFFKQNEEKFQAKAINENKNVKDFFLVKDEDLQQLDENTNSRQLTL